MATEYHIDIMMSGNTITKLKASGFALYGFKAVNTKNGGAAPLVWFQTVAQVLLPTTIVKWEEQYEAYVSASQIIPNGVISASSTAPIDLGDTADVNEAGLLHVVQGGTRSAIALHNRSKLEWTCGISQSTGGGQASPLVAIPLYGQMLDVIAPIEKVLLMFASPTVNTGTVIYKSYSTGVVVDLTGAPGKPPTRTVNFDINDGWNWGSQKWGTPVQAEDDLVPILISSS